MATTPGAAISPTPRTSPPATERRLTARGRERRRQLMAFARQRFAERGYHATSVGEIVQGMGVGKGLFYWYFESKEDLFLEILREASVELRRAQRAAIGEEADPVRRIELGVRASLHWLDGHRDMFSLIQFAATESRFAPTLRRQGEATAADLVRHVGDAMAAGAIDAADPEMLAQAVLGVTNQLAHAYLLTGRATAEEVADLAVRFCVQGLVGSR